MHTANTAQYGHAGMASGTASTGIAGAAASILDRFPDEILVSIISHLADDRFTLCSLARTCSFFRHECEKSIYSSIDLFSTQALLTINYALDRRPERIASVQSLNVMYSFFDGISHTLQWRRVFNAFVEHMKALRTLQIESPFDNFQWNSEGANAWVEEDMEAFREALEAACLRAGNGRLAKSDHVGLARLEKLTIHSHGPYSDFWQLGDFHCLFRHPTLRHLHVSCLVLPTDIPDLEPYAGCNALSTLIFDESILEPKSLERILKTPKSLKHLTLGENVYNDQSNIPDLSYLTESPLLTLQALSAVAHSLESLVHLDPSWKRTGSATMYRPRAVEGNGLCDFHSLTFMDIDPCSFLHQFILSYSQAPPNLETFRIHHTAHVEYVGAEHAHPTNLFRELPSVTLYTHVGSLRTLEFVQQACLNSYLADPIYICGEQPFRDRHTRGYELFKHGINLKVYVEGSFASSIMPPYLHGEQKPELLCVYDAADIGFRRHVYDDDKGTRFFRGHMKAEVRLPDGCLDEETFIEAPTQEEEEAKEVLPPETDKLGRKDMGAVQNRLGRAIWALKDRLARESSDPSMEDEFDDDEDEDDDYYDDDDDDVDDEEP